MTENRPEHLPDNTPEQVSPPTFDTAGQVPDSNPEQGSPFLAGATPDRPSGTSSDRVNDSSESLSEFRVGDSLGKHADGSDILTPEQATEAFTKGFRKGMEGNSDKPADAQPTRRTKLYGDGMRATTTVDADGSTTGQLDMGARGRVLISQAKDGPVTIERADGVQHVIEAPEGGGRVVKDLGNGVRGVVNFKKDGTWTMDTRYTKVGSGPDVYDDGSESSPDAKVDDLQAWLKSSPEAKSIRSGDTVYQRAKVGDEYVTTARDDERRGYRTVHLGEDNFVHLGPERNSRRRSLDNAGKGGADSGVLFANGRSKSLDKMSSGDKAKEEEDFKVLELNVDNRLKRLYFWKKFQDLLANGEAVCLKTRGLTVDVEKKIGELLRNGSISPKDLHDVLIIGQRGQASVRFDREGKPIRQQHKSFTGSKDLEGKVYSQFKEDKANEKREELHPSVY